MHQLRPYFTTHKENGRLSPLILSATAFSPANMLPPLRMWRRSLKIRPAKLDECRV